MFQKYTLNNRANIILVPLPDTCSVTVLVMYQVGSRYEPERLAGVSHFIEHLMFKGTARRPSTLILTREIDRLGAEYNAFTGKESTGYYIKTDARYTTVALDILSDMLLHSSFEPEEMEREKGPIIEELRMYKDNPLINIDNIFEGLMYKGCPLGRDIGGTERHVESYQRREVLAYRDKYYGAGNMTMVVAGKLEDKVKEWVRHYFGQRKSQRSRVSVFKPYTYGPNQPAERLVIERKRTDQVQLMFGFPGLKQVHPQNPAVSVLNTILGGSMSSRLFIQIRERRGLAYMVKSGVEHFRDTGYAYVKVGLEAKNINQAIKVARGEMEKLIDKGVSQRELADAKTHIRGALTLTLEDSSAQANWYARAALFDQKIETPEEKLKKIERVTREQVRAVAKRLFKWPEVRVALIGDVESLPNGTL